MNRRRQAGSSMSENDYKRFVFNPIRILSRALYRGTFPAAPHVPRCGIGPAIASLCRRGDSGRRQEMYLRSNGFVLIWPALVIKPKFLQRGLLLGLFQFG